jgi:hypothetical protein
VDLLLTFIEAGIEQAVDLGYGDDSYFSAIERKLDAVVKSWPDLSPAVRAQAGKRLDWVSKRAQNVGWGYGDYVDDVARALQASNGRV